MDICEQALGIKTTGCFVMKCQKTHTFLHGEPIIGEFLHFSAIMGFSQNTRQNVRHRDVDFLC